MSTEQTANQATDPRLAEMPERPSQVVNLAGEIVDTSTNVWDIFHANGNVIKVDKFSINNACVERAIELFLISEISRKSPRHVEGVYKVLSLLNNSSYFCHDAKNGKDIRINFFEEMRDYILSNYRSSGFYLHHLRQWYCWCADMGFPYFDADTAVALGDITIGADEKGRAVRSHDPNEGPLAEAEVVALQHALQAESRAIADGRGRLSTSELGMLWLSLALGPNPENLALLREEDVHRLEGGSGEPYFMIRVPRIKKGHSRKRTDFRLRKITNELGKVLEEIIEVNSKRYKTQIQSERFGRPLFRRAEPVRSVIGTDREPYAFHQAPNQIAYAVRQAVRKLDLRRADDSGQPLHVTPRRLRYSFATRLVKEGASRLEVAEALDHSDTQHVDVYFSAQSDVVPYLDKATALALAPLAQAFMGMIVDTEADAVRSDPNSRIFHGSREDGVFGQVGNCGLFSFCGLNAPLACYTCPLFNPWIDGPHESVLDSLLRERDRKAAAGADNRSVQINDQTIYAVGLVVERCREARQERGLEAGES